MIKKLLKGLEIISFMAVALFGVMWMRNPSGNYEPTISFLSGTIGALLEVVRRRIQAKEEIGVRVALNSSARSIHEWLLANTPSANLSFLLPYALELAKKLKAKEFEKWVRLELNGYIGTSGKLAADIPEYRTVSGQHTDEFNRPLILPSAEYNFINRTRLSHSVKELEMLAQTQNMLFIRDLGAIESIKENLEVQ